MKKTSAAVVLLVTVAEIADHYRKALQALLFVFKRGLDHVGPESAKILYATCGRTKQRGVADQQLSCEGIRARLQERVEA